MATEIGTLTARFIADTTQFDRGLKNVEGGMKKTATQAQALQGAMNNALSRISPQMASLVNSVGGLSASMSGLTIALGTAAASFAAVAIAAVGAGKVIYDLATSAADTADKFGDMADKINFSVRTLSGLEVAADASGSSLEGLSTALGIFDRNLENAAQGDERLSGLFKALKIDVNNNEVAFRQVAKVLTDLDGSAQQTALAMELFGRSGRDVLGILKTAEGDIDGFIAQMEALGIVVGTDAVKAADKLDMQLKIMWAQLGAVKRQLGEEFIPMVNDAAAAFSNWMKNNQGEIRKTIRDIGDLIKTIIGLRDLILAISPITLIVQTVSNIRSMTPNARDMTNEEQQSTVYTIDPVTGRRIYAGNAPYDTSGEYAVAGGAGERSVGAGPGGAAAAAPANSLADQIRKLLARGGGGGGGGRRANVPNMPRVPKGRDESVMLEELELVNELTKAITFSTKDWSVALESVGRATKDIYIKAGGEQIELIKSMQAVGGEDAQGRWQEPDRWAFGKGNLTKTTKAVNEWADDISNIFGNLFDNIDRGWKGMLNSLVRDLQSIGSRIVTNQIFRILSQIGMNNDFVGTKATGIGDTPVLGKAAGGPVSGGTPYIVGERGPELFVPQASGNIVPNGGGTMRIAIFDDQRRMADFRPDMVLRARKQMRKIGKLATV